MSLKDKLAKVNVGKIAADGAARRKEGHAPDAQKTAIGFHVDSIYSDRKIAEENERLKESVAKFEGSEPSKKLDPKTIKPSRWANRSEQSFHSKEFADLKKEIESAGGNVQAIKVRPLAGSETEFEIVFGHRRHRACLELDLPVLALIEPISNAELFSQMDRENRQRADLRPYEQGLMYARALDEALFPSMRKMAESLGVDASIISKAVVVARLPQRVLEAFPSPLDIQFNWATLLTSVIQKDPDAVLNRATEVLAMDPRPSGSKTFKHLVGESSNERTPGKDVDVTGKSGAKSTISFNIKTKVFSIAITGLEKNKLTALEKLLKEL